MDESTLKEALEHDAAQKGQAVPVPLDPLKTAAMCLQNSIVAVQGAVAGIEFCKPPAVTESRKLVQLAIAGLEQALVLMSLEEPFSV